MNAVRLHRRIASDTLHLPELHPLIGKVVEIIILEEPMVGTSSDDRWEPLREAAGKDLIDPEAYKELRAKSVT